MSEKGSGPVPGVPPAGATGPAAGDRPAFDFSQILRASPIGISISRLRDGRISEMNDEFLRILGFAREEVLGRTSHELDLWVSPEQRQGIIREIAEKGFYAPRPTPMRRKDGTTVTILFSASPLAGGPEPQGITWVVDITERVHLEERLRASEERWRTLTQYAPVALLSLDGQGKVLSMNRTITGRAVEEYVGLGAWEYLLPEYREQGRASVESVLAGGPPMTGEFPILGPDGAPRWFQVSIAPVGFSTGPERAVLVATDIEARRRTEEDLRASEQRFRDMVLSMGDWFWETDAAGRLTYSSQQVEGLLGYTAQEMLGKTPWDTAVPEERERARGAIAALAANPRPFRDRELWHLHRDGRRVCLSASGVPVHAPGGALRGFRGVIHDVTEHKREEEERLMLETEVQQARRVESLGVLAGGIAHDFNNLLTAVLGNAELALFELPEGAARGYVAQIQAAGQHAAELTRQMLAYAGRGFLAVERVDLNNSVREMTQLLKASVSKKVALALDLAEGLPAVQADPAQLWQVIMNLVINAADAIGDREGRIAVRTAAGLPADTFHAAFALGRIEAGRDRVCIEVADTGGGIDPGHVGKIFDPFFTTKFAGRGLGLAAVQGIVLRHEGKIEVSTAAGEGSTFRVCFPALAPLEEEVPAAPPAGAPAAPPGAPWKGSGKVLLVDDEEPVRRMAATMLRVLGFEVLTAGDGEEAVSTAAAEEGLRAVLLDLTMPRLDGRETFRKLHRLRPGLPVVLCSGYDISGGDTGLAGLGFSGFLRKPFRIDDLRRALRGALGE